MTICVEKKWIAGLGQSKFCVKSKIKFWVLCGLLLPISIPAWAQPAPGISAAQEAQRQRAKEDAARREEKLTAPSVSLQGEEGKKTPIGAFKLPIDKTCYKINRFELEVPKQLPVQVLRESGYTRPQDTFYFLSKRLDSIRGQCVGQLGMSAIVNQLSLDLVSHGYTTTRIGMVPEQELSSGVMKLTLLPGYLGSFRFKSKDPAVPVKPASVKTAYPTKPGHILNLRDLEQGLEQMQRVSSFSASMELVPGALPGETDVVITLSREKPWTLSVSLDNSGVTSTGKMQAGSSFAYNDLLGLNDTLSFGVTHDADQMPDVKGSKSKNASFSVPWGNWLFSTSGSQNSSHQLITNTSGSSSISSSKQASIDGRVSYMFFRTQEQKNTVEFHTGKNWNDSYINDTQVNVSHRMTAFAEMSVMHRHYFGQAKLDLTASYRWGVPWFGAQDDTSFAEQGLINPPALHYNYKVLDATLSMPFPFFGRTANYTGTLHGQFTQSSLDPNNFFSIGNRWSVRGFDGDSTLSAEQGYYMRNEIAVPVGKTNQSFYVGLEAGRVFGPNDITLSGTGLIGSAVGLRGSFYKGMSYDLWLGIPIHRPQNWNSAATLSFTASQSF